MTITMSGISSPLSQQLSPDSLYPWAHSLHVATLMALGSRHPSTIPAKRANLIPHDLVMTLVHQAWVPYPLLDAQRNYMDGGREGEVAPQSKMGVLLPKPGCMGVQEGEPCSAAQH